MTERSRDWWDGHLAGFVKGLEEARLQAIRLAAEETSPHSPAAISLRLLAAELYQLKEQGG